MSLLRELFDGDEDDLFRAFASSLQLDLWIVEEDIEGSIAHVSMLGETGILSTNEADTLVEGLQQILDEFRDGAWSPDASQEDIHMAVEARLTDIVGDPHSCILDRLTTMSQGTFVKVVGWYDNEWGYSNRAVDAMELIGESL